MDEDLWLSIYLTLYCNEELMTSRNLNITGKDEHLNKRAEKQNLHILEWLFLENWIPKRYWNWN